MIWLDVHDLYRDPTGDPYLSFRNLFLKWNDEIIFATSKTDWEWGHDKRCTPQPGGYSMMQATQNIVDAFYTRDGLDKDDDENYTETGFATSDDPAEYGMAEDGVNRGYLMGESNMYVNREPRFYASISYNGRPVLAAQTVDDKNYYSSDANKDGRGRAGVLLQRSGRCGPQPDAARPDGIRHSEDGQPVVESPPGCGPPPLPPLHPYPLCRDPAQLHRGVERV